MKWIYVGRCNLCGKRQSLSNMGSNLMANDNLSPTWDAT